MKNLYIPIGIIVAFGLMAFSCEKGSAPPSDDTAWCKTHYSDQAACEADAKCVWKPADPAKSKPERCGAK